MSGKLLTEHYLKFLSLKGGCTGSSESTLVKMPHCLKSHVAAQKIIGSLGVMNVLDLCASQPTYSLGQYRPASEIPFDSGTRLYILICYI